MMLLTIMNKEKITALIIAKKKKIIRISAYAQYFILFKFYKDDIKKNL